DMVDTPAALVLPTDTAPVPTPVPEVVFTGDATVNVKGLNMRKGPGTQFESLGSFAAGTRLSLLGKDSSGVWANVQSAEGLVGWMSVKYVTLSVPIENVPVVPGY
ncbi:MAG: SH3 domain-containing protein, partial [Chloroflexia bacterium]